MIIPNFNILNLKKNKIIFVVGEDSFQKIKLVDCIINTICQQKNIGGIVYFIDPNTNFYGKVDSLTDSIGPIIKTYDGSNAIEMIPKIFVRQNILASKSKGNKKFLPNTIIVINIDILFDNDLFNQLFFNHRCYGITLIITNNNFIDVPDKYLQEVNHIFLSDNQKVDCTKKIWQTWAPFNVSFDTFITIFNNVSNATEYHTLIIDYDRIHCCSKLYCMIKLVE